MAKYEVDVTYRAGGFATALQTVRYTGIEASSPRVAMNRGMRSTEVGRKVPPAWIVGSSAKRIGS